MAIRYEVLAPDGTSSINDDMSLSISEDTSVYEQFAALPSDQVVGEDFEAAPFYELSRLISTPGRYQIRALYAGVTSNWCDLLVEA